jgi:DNA-directed RNA polymerase sigma subunit (sigma70/sigma32)
MELETLLEINEYEEFTEKGEVAEVAFKSENGFIPELTEKETRFESEGTRSDENEEKQAFNSEEYRFLYTYFKELARESLLTPREEVEIATKIKKCQVKVNEIRILRDNLLKERNGNDGGNENHNGKKKDSSRQIRRLNSLMKTYATKAQGLRERFLRGNLRLVVSIARKYTGLGLSLSDLIQAGNLGLMRAMERFDPAKGYRFSTYASWWIRQSISRAISAQARTVRIPEYVLEQARKVHRVRSVDHEDKGIKPIPGEIAEKTGISVKHVKRILEATNEIVYLDSPVFLEGEKITFLDFVADDRSSGADSLIAKAELKERVDEALSSLTEREKEIIRMRFGMDDDIVYTLDEVGKRLNLTRERIRQLEENAIRKIARSERREILESFCE